MLDLADHSLFPRSPADVPARRTRGLWFLTRAIGATWRRSLAALDHREDRRHLRSLPDHLLRDIGLTRSQIDEALKGRAGRNDDSLRHVSR